MKLRKMPLKKSAKFLILLLTSMLIASVSAVTYISLTMESTIAVYKSNVYFVAGSDDGIAGLVVTLDSTNTTATLTGLRAYPNATFTYSDPVRVRNNATSGSNPQLRLAPKVDPSANPEDFEYVKFLLNASSTDDRWLNYTSNGSSWTSPTGPTSWTITGIAPSTEWSIVIYTKATAGATVTDSVDISITVDVY